PYLAGRANGRPRQGAFAILARLAGRDGIALPIAGTHPGLAQAAGLAAVGVNVASRVTDRLPHVGAGAAVDVAGLHLACLRAARAAPIRVDDARSSADRLPDPRTIAHALATHVAIETAVVLALAPVGHGHPLLAGDAAVGI